MAYNFNGANQYLTTPSAVVNSAPLTMCCWFNPANTTASFILLSITGIGGVSNTRFGLVANGAAAGDPLAVLTTNVAGQSASASTTTSYIANNWQHAAGVFSASSSRSVYLNAGGVASNTTDISPSNLAKTNIGVQFIIPGGASGNGFAISQIAEVGIWNAALTQPEIASLADGMTCDKIRPQSIVFYAPLVRDLIDAKGGLTLTNNNGATVANHPRIYP